MKHGPIPLDFSWYEKYFLEHAFTMQILPQGVESYFGGVEEKKNLGVPQQKQIQLGTRRMQVWSLALLSRLRIRPSVAVSCGVGCRHGSDLVWVWLWLWCGPAATALIWPLAWEHPYATDVALKRQKTKKKKLTHIQSTEIHRINNP